MSIFVKNEIILPLIAAEILAGIVVDRSGFDFVTIPRTNLIAHHVLRATQVWVASALPGKFGDLHGSGVQGLGPTSWARPNRRAMRWMPDSELA